MTKDDLLSILQYDRDTGTFTRIRPHGAYRAGSIAGAINAKGYRQISVRGVLYYAHRLVWLAEHGGLPDGLIDHINRNRSDNRIQNLRVVSAKENMENTGMYASNASGYKGVHWDRQYGKWVAIVNHNRKRVFAGRYDNVYDAHQAYERKVAQLFTCR
jgi:hypothetical protein